MDILEAAKNGELESLKQMLDQGADMFSVDKYGFTALMKASEQGHLDVVKFLVERGADVNQKNLLDWTALCYAATRRKLPVVQFLVENGADIDANCQGRPIIKWVLQQSTDHMPDEEKLLDIIDYLVSKGVKTDSQIIDYAREVSRDRSFQKQGSNPSYSSSKLAEHTAI